MDIPINTGALNALRRGHITSISKLLNKNFGKLSLNRFLKNLLYQFYWKIKFSIKIIFP